jgi:glycosyltransferase involved in cell wall biosynthesis
MKVALVTEGTYPIHSGGVSHWCDQLIRALPDIRFDVVALSGSGRERLTYALPAHVQSLRRVGLWGAAHRPLWLSRRVKERFASAYRQFLESILEADSFAPARFETALRSLHELARDGQLTASLRSQASIDVFLDVWSRHSPSLLGSDADQPITLADVLMITDFIEHYLRPLQTPPLDADLVHATANGPSTVVGLLTKWERNTPVIVSEHGVYLRERILSIRASAGSTALRATLIRFFVRLTELGYRTADAILPVSDFNSRWALRAGALPTSVRTIHNGVDPAAFPFIEDEPDVPTLSYVGRIDPLKDLETLIRAFALVRGQLPEARLRLFGPVPAGNESYAALCEKLVADLGLVDSVTFEGPISPAGRAFAAGHVVVLSSISEGLPLTIIEAAMSGRPTVATDVGGMSEAVGEGGLIVPARDPRAFADASLRLLRNHAFRRKFAAIAHERALTHFTLERLVEDFRGVYEEMMSRKAAERETQAAELPIAAEAT